MLSSDLLSNSSDFLSSDFLSLESFFSPDGLAVSKKTRLCVNQMEKKQMGGTGGAKGKWRGEGLNEATIQHSKYKLNDTLFFSIIAEIINMRENKTKSENKV